MSTERKPAWLSRRAGTARETFAVRGIVAGGGLHTVCQSARCPNLGECFAAGTATFMILGEACTRDCRFCAVTHGRPADVDGDEPRRVAGAAAAMGLSHVVVTSVTRDDLPGGGADQFAATVAALRRALPAATVEILTPDFRGSPAAIDIAATARPDIFNHNVETVPSLYGKVRPGADYRRSLDLLARVRERHGLATKSGIMAGFGETEAEMAATLADLRAAGVEMVTIGQYLQPTRRHLPVAEYVTPERFDRYRQMGESLGFSSVFSGPYVRSSYRAGEFVSRRAVAGRGA